MTRPCRAALLCLVFSGCIPDPKLQIPDFSVPFMPLPDASGIPDMAVKPNPGDGGTDSGAPDGGSTQADAAATDAAATDAATTDAKAGGG